MNERIRELAKRAEIPNNILITTFPGKTIEKFAELIVKECADYLDAFNKEHHVLEGISGAELKQHFGVEE